MDLILDRNNFTQARNEMNTHRGNLSALITRIRSSFTELQRDWDSEAGREFFAKRIERDLLDRLNDHVLVFDHISQNLNMASQRYEEVFSAADNVASSQF